MTIYKLTWKFFNNDNLASSASLNIFEIDILLGMIKVLLQSDKTISVNTEILK